MRKNLQSIFGEFETYLISQAPKVPSFHPYFEKALWEMVENGGKRFRPKLLLSIVDAYKPKSIQKAFSSALALEILHTYSLIHDDLPAMDNDDWRRGKPTCHKQFDEATAILAGDALLTYAFEIMSHKNTHPDPQVRCQLVQLLAQAAGGFRGMVAGQMLDLLAENMQNPNNPEELIRKIEEMKTGRLLRFAIEAGAVLGQADMQAHNALMLYAMKIGLTFQISDDILDVEGNQALVGKTLHKDEAQNKLTFVSLYGLQGAKDLAKKLTNEAIAALEMFGNKAANLINLAQFIIERDR